MKPILIGKAPNKNSEGLRPFAGRAGRRIAELCGLGDTGDVLPEAFELFNLLDVYPGNLSQNAVGYAFCHLEDVREKAWQLRAWLALYPDSRIIVLVGRHVETALMGKGEQPFCTSQLRRFDHWHADRNELVGSQFHRVLVIPHLSGVVTWWNDPHNVQKAELILRQFLRQGGKA